MRVLWDQNQQLQAIRRKKNAGGSCESAAFSLDSQYISLDSIFVARSLFIQTQFALARMV
jgi:hypothetical protein